MAIHNQNAFLLDPGFILKDPAAVLSPPIGVYGPIHFRRVLWTATCPAGCSLQKFFLNPEIYPHCRTRSDLAKPNSK